METAVEVGSGTLPKDSVQCSTQGEADKGEPGIRRGGDGVREVTGWLESERRGEKPP